MPIRYNCACGARIKFPDGAAGKKARCNACGKIFRVPLIAVPESIAEATEVSHAATPVRSAAEPPTPAESEDDGLFRLSDFEDGPAVNPPTSIEVAPTALPPDAPRMPNSSPHDVIERSHRPFWSDLVLSFILCGKPTNWLTFGGLVLVSWLLSMIFVFGSRLFCWIVFVQIGLAGYICATLLSTVLETAHGEDRLPNVSVREYWEDLFLPALQFFGTWLLALSPALIVFLVVALYDLPDLAPLVPTMAILGAVFWPVIVLCVAVGGTLKLSPAVIVRTVIAAPLPYAVICAGVLLAGAMTFLPESEHFADIISDLRSQAGVGSYLAFVLVTKGINIYAALVAMRIIGLYYRHFKDRFPWTAE